MTATKNTHSQVREQVAVLADQLAQDIANRNLMVGDRYLTTAEVAAEFHVRRSTANLAMRLLASRGILVRRMRSGTFVGRQAVAGAETQVKTLYLVESADRLRHYSPLYDTIGIIRQRLPQVSIHLNIVPVHGALDYACDLVRHARAAGNAVGFILISCPRDVYRYFAETEMPAVVISDVYMESDSLPTLDGDQLEAGRLLADHLLHAGHRRIALLTHANWLAGDNRFLAGVTKALQDAQMPLGSLVVRSVTDTPTDFAQNAADLWSQPDRPTAFICRTLAQAESIAKATAGFEAAQSGEPKIVFGVVSGQLADDCRFAYVCQQGMAAQIDRALGMLDAVSRQPNVRGQHVRLPIELVVPRKERAANQGKEPPQ